MCRPENEEWVLVVNDGGELSYVIQTATEHF
jgi:hypothetical protein